MASCHKLGRTVLHPSMPQYWCSMKGLMLHHTAQYQSMLCYAVTYNAALCYKRLRHNNQSTWLQGHQSANQLASHWRARLHGKHSFTPSLPPLCHVFFFFPFCLWASLAIMEPFERGSKARCTYLPTAHRAWKGRERKKMQNWSKRREKRKWYWK